MIAEIGINHNADLYIAKRLIDAAFATGWDCVKFQKKNPAKCVPEDQKHILKDTPWGRMTYLEYKEKMEFGVAAYDYINQYCMEKPIQWTASVWDTDSLIFLMNYDVPFIKVPSAKITDAGLMEAVAETGKRVIISTGMSTVQEIDEAVAILQKYGADYAILHTNSMYPAPIEDLNLRAIPFLKERYKCTVGYSGHEYGLEPTVIAVALGAEIIERHVTLDHNMWGTDQAASLEIHAMDMLRKRINEVQASLGDGVKKVTDGEMQIRLKLRGN